MIARLNSRKIRIMANITFKMGFHFIIYALSKISYFTISKVDLKSLTYVQKLMENKVNITKRRDIFNFLKLGYIKVFLNSAE